MMQITPLRQRTFQAPCTVEIEHTADSLHAHVEIDAKIGICPGDEVLVHDAPTDVPFGERIVVARTATIVRAGLAVRLWTRLAGHFEMNELYEVSFTERRSL